MAKVEKRDAEREEEENTNIKKVTMRENKR